MALLSIRLSPEIDSRLTRAARLDGKNRSALAREAIQEYLKERERKLFLTEIARAARAIEPGEARALAEEALLIDNEALAIAEEQRPYGVARKKPRNRRKQ